MVATSLEDTKNLFVWPPHLFPAHINLQNYINVFHASGLGLWLVNTTKVALGTSLIALVVSIFCGYSLARFRFRGKAASELTLLATQMFPGVLLVLPIFILFSQWHLLDSLVGLTIAYLSFVIPVSTLFLKGFFETVPIELEEAAIVDGASRLGALFRIVLPLSLPGLMTSFLFGFIIAWNEYLFARTFIQTPEHWLVSLGLASYIGEYVTPWDQIMSAASIVTLPVCLLFLFLQRYLLQGLTLGAVKG
jgi:ABC-type glycerol-3-phosphate transport system permease component